MNTGGRDAGSDVDEPFGAGGRALPGRRAGRVRPIPLSFSLRGGLCDPATGRWSSVCMSTGCPLHVNSSLESVCPPGSLPVYMFMVYMFINHLTFDIEEFKVLRDQDSKESSLSR